MNITEAWLLANGVDPEQLDRGMRIAEESYRSTKGDPPHADPPLRPARLANPRSADVGGVPVVAKEGETVKPKRPAKYRNTPTVYDGVRYDSKAEAARAEHLDSMQAEETILWWLPKPGSFRLGVPENVYRPDFLVVGLDATWCEDVKGRETPKFRRDRKLWQKYGPCQLHIIKGSCVEVVIPDELEES